METKKEFTIYDLADLIERLKASQDKGDTTVTFFGSYSVVTPSDNIIVTNQPQF
jgi:hypothetical protein